MNRKLVTLVLVSAILLVPTQVYLAQTGRNMGLEAGFWPGASSGTPSTILSLVSFSATAEGQEIRIHWETASEMDLVGFNLFRALTADGPQEGLNETLILTQSPGSPNGAIYEFLDVELPPGQTYFYWLETVDLHGASTNYGPVSATVELAPPQQISPSSGSKACSRRPEFSWQAVDGAASYQIQVATDAGFTALVVDDTTTETGFAIIPASALGEGLHYWHVLAQTPGTQSPWSAAWRYTVTPLPPAPLLSSPKDQAEISASPFALTWYAVPGATNYRVELDDDADFSSPEMAVDTQTTTHTVAAALPAGQYHWRVLGSNVCGDGPWSNPWLVKFYPAPDTPSLQEPADGAATTDTTPTFYWTAVGHAAGYRIEIATDERFGSPELTDSATGTSYTVATPLPHGTHYWRIQTVPHGSSPPSTWSPAWRLTINMYEQIYLPLVIH